MNDLDPYPPNLRQIRSDGTTQMQPDIEVLIKKSRAMKEARRLLSTLRIEARDDVSSDAAGNTLVTAGAMFVKWPAMNDAIDFYKRLNPSGHHSFPVATYHLCVINWLIGLVCGDVEPQKWE